ncbi:hypothetical protein [Mycobacteroides abscessus]|uniref:hypothetical protein n=1 Tax=Mycobacteroides abscessus TaxID=36809 RepID=UPI000258512F|nr:hypothetical protein [Mycobacteroides abscessus]EIC67161.1 hypothetical protein OUW_05493 [Mycobacteroides abscessus M93]
MPVRRGAGLQTLSEKLAERCPDKFLDLRPYIRSPGGLPRYTKELAAWIDQETADSERDIHGMTTGQRLACDVMRELGIDLAEWFRIQLERQR